jgi:molybdate transport system substrate-binding protein
VSRPIGASLATALALAGLALSAAGVPAAPAAGTKASARITVYAAASLTNVFPRIERSPRYSFGGSNTLAAQIRQGAPADVFASANMMLPQQLFARKLCSRPVVFTRNAIVIVVPRSNPAKLRSIYGLTRRGIKLVIAGPGVPVGSYTLQVLRNMNLAAAILPNVVSRETDVREVLAKVILGEADAGFVYATDAKVAGGRVSVLNVPARAQPQLQYGICVVSGSANKSEARAFVDKVLAEAGQAKLRAAGFLPRVKSRR